MPAERAVGRRLGIDQHRHMARLQPGLAQGDERAEPGLPDRVVQHGHALFGELGGEIHRRLRQQWPALSRETAAPASR